jgi:hypothetical protein
MRRNEMPDERASNSWLAPGQGAEYEQAGQDYVGPGVSFAHPDRCTVRGNPPAEAAEVERATERMHQLAGN